MTTFQLARVMSVLCSIVWAAVASVAAEPVTAKQVVARCAEALGGAEKVAAVQTIRIQMVVASKAKAVTHEIKRPNRIRSEADYVLVFDGKRAGYLKGAPSKDGRDPGPQLLPAEEGRDFEVDIAFLFPAFFEYPAEYLGVEVFDGKKCHKLGVSLPLGIRMTYFLDAGSSLPVRIVADFPHGGTTYHPERTVGEYAPAGGILFPRAMTSTGWGFQGGATVTKVEVNAPLPDERFEMPERVG